MAGSTRELNLQPIAALDRSHPGQARGALDARRQHGQRACMKDLPELDVREVSQHASNLAHQLAVCSPLLCPSFEYFLALLQVLLRILKACLLQLNVSNTAPSFDIGRKERPTPDFCGERHSAISIRPPRRHSISFSADRHFLIGHTTKVFLLSFVADVLREPWCRPSKSLLSAVRISGFVSNPATFLNGRPPANTKSDGA